MLLNSSDPQHVKFISYDGKFPNLCSGMLHLIIDGQNYLFCAISPEYSSSAKKKVEKIESEHGECKICESFWSTGGSCGFRGHYSDPYVTHGEWNIDVEYLPDEIKQYAHEINEVFNDNVDYGCCGGCI